ncbi:MAG: sodium-dependent transporter, partial [Erysipelotrichaceae bacterium]|nr:sodium-dependent transporter [Erysipelotrichaceae bacterium]
LEPKGTKWHWAKWLMFAGNYCLMMFYTTVCGWMFYYFYLMLTGYFRGLDSAGIEMTFQNMLQSPAINVGFMIFVVCSGFFIISLGFNNGVERISKHMTMCLLALMFILAVRSITLPEATEGLRYYLVPDVSRFTQHGLSEVITATMGQTFFTLSLGVGAIAIFGSYIDKEKKLTGEAIQIIALDTIIAIIAGLIIIPACFAYDVDPSQGPGLVFISLPVIFSHMPMGQFWGVLFFLCMTFAAMTTVIAVFQALVDMIRDLTGCEKRTSVLVNLAVMIVLCLPCALGFNVWSFIQPMGEGTTIQDLEDFIVSNNLLPIGSLIYVLFCSWKAGWGFSAFIKEANTGKGISFPAHIKWYCAIGIPLIILFIFVQGYVTMFG